MQDSCCFDAHNSTLLCVCQVWVFSHAGICSLHIGFHGHVPAVCEADVFTGTGSTVGVRNGRSGYVPAKWFYRGLAMGAWGGGEDEL